LRALVDDAVQNLVEPLAGGLLVDGRVVQEREVDGLLGLVASPSSACCCWLCMNPRISSRPVPSCSSWPRAG
jgi:hypothetical protein